MSDPTPVSPSPTAPAPDQARVLNTATLLMGVSGAGKSSLIATAIEYVWETYHAVSFYYLFDGGGFPTQVQALVRLGIAKLWKVRSRSTVELAPETIHRAAQGWWPSRINPITGETDPAVRLVAPYTTAYQQHCAKGHLVKSSSSQAGASAPGQCPVCKDLVTPATMKLEKVSARTKGFPERRAVFYDGITAANSWLLGDLAMRELGGEQSRLGGKVVSGDLTFGENNRAQVGFAQNRSEQWVLASAGIPDLVIPPVWTALTTEGEGEGGLTIVGPVTAGQARTAMAPQWFGNTIEAAVAEVDGKKFRRLYTQQYVDPQNRRHLCRIGAYPGEIPAILEDEDRGGEGAFTQFNLGLVFRLLDQARERTEAQYRTRYANAPGVGADVEEFGEAAPAPSAPATPAAPPRPAVSKPSAPVASPAASAPKVASVPPPTPAPTAAPVVAKPAGAPMKPPAPTATPKVAPSPASPVRPAAPAGTPVATAPPAPKPPARGPAPPPGRTPSPR